MIVVFMNHISYLGSNQYFNSESIDFFMNKRGANVTKSYHISLPMFFSIL